MGAQFVCVGKLGANTRQFVEQMEAPSFGIVPPGVDGAGMSLFVAGFLCVSRAKHAD